MIQRYSILLLSFLFSSSALAQLEQIQQIPGLPNYVSATDGGGHPVQFPNGDIGIIYDVQTDYSVNDFGPDVLYLIRSTDGGATWSAPVELDSSNNHQGLCCMASAVNTNGRVILWYYNKGGSKLIYSDDSGVTWTTSPTPPNMGDGQSDVAAGPNGSFVATNMESGNFNARTSVDGVTWSGPTVIVNGAFLCGGTVAATSETRVVFVYEECWFNRGDPRPQLMATSDDGGATWSAPSEIFMTGSGFGRWADSAFDGSGVLWLVHVNGEDLSYTSSDDGGVTWAASTQWTDNTGSGPGFGDFDQDFAHNVAMVNGQPFTVFSARRGNDEFTLFYGVPGVSSDPLVTSVEQISDVIPTTFNLRQNYPNPFNPGTNIHFSLPQVSQVRLSVFDILGREITRLAEGEYPAGEYQLSWDASDLPSGTYIYRLETPAGTQTKKMLLLK